MGKCIRRAEKVGKSGDGCLAKIFDAEYFWSK